MLICSKTKKTRYPLLKIRIFFHKLFNWEYWPFQVVYVPIYFQWAFYALRERHIFFFNACNPNIKNGGYLNESKKDIYDQLPQEAYPTTILVSPETDFDSCNAERERSNIVFPCIAKPDMGLRGSAVVKLENSEQWLNYHQQADFKYILQNLIPYSSEVGIFYVRFPGEENGRITGIVGKEFMTVVGDGKSTIEQLLLKNLRFAMQLSAIKRQGAINLQEVLKVGERKIIVPFGNHARGSKFYDYSDWITTEMCLGIEKYVKQMPDFYFGRIDVMFKSKADLQAGKNFMFVEVNGAGSEPTHIYDPKHGIFFAWNELCRHFRYMYRISRMNHKRGFRYLTFREGMAELRMHNKLNHTIQNF